VKSPRCLIVNDSGTLAVLLVYQLTAIDPNRPDGQDSQDLTVTIIGTPEQQWKAQQLIYELLYRHQGVRAAPSCVCMGSLVI